MSETLFADTNLFLRYLTNDVPEQADAVERLLHRAAAAEGLVLVTNALVVAEIVWTLDSYYGVGRDAIREMVLALLNTAGLQVDGRDLLLQAITTYAERNVDFIDAYNGAWMLAQEITTACTFDRKHFARLDGIRVQVPG